MLIKLKSNNNNKYILMVNAKHTHILYNTTIHSYMYVCTVVLYVYNTLSQ